MNDKELDEMYTTSGNGEYMNKTEFPMEGLGSVKIETYGEFNRNGVETYINYFKDHLNENSVFYDLGSGLGKMVIHIGEEANIKKSIGVEYSKERHIGATHLKENYVSDNDRISFINGDILKQDLSDATIIYFDNTCYSNEMCEEIYNLLPKGCLITYKRYFPHLDFNIQKKIVDVEFERTYNQNQLVVHTKGDV
jgi:SAM-dependent methyltransferase